MRGYGLVSPPKCIQRAKLDNLALVPGDLLPYRDAWQKVANRLPANSVLIVVPKDNKVQKQTMLVVAKLLAAAGHQVRVVPDSQVGREHSRKTMEAPRP